MAVETAEDRATFVDSDDFGVEAAYTLAGGDATTIEGLFDESTEDRFTAPGVVAAVKTLQVRTADLPTGARAGSHTGDRLTIEGQTYKPMTFERDISGAFTTVRLDTAV